MKAVVAIHVICSTIRVKAPLDSVPLFVRAGSVISVLDPSVQTLSNASNSSVITYFDKKV